MPFGQKYTILRNLKSDLDSKLKRVSFTEKIWTLNSKKEFYMKLKQEDDIENEK